MRLFIALELPPAVRQDLAQLCHGIPGARWVAEENFHLTLRFLGELDGGQARDVDTALAAVRAEGFSLCLSGLGQFGDGRKLRALWVGVEANDSLRQLQQRVENSVVAAGLPREGRKYRPHVTLARFKSNPGEKFGMYLASHSLFRAGPWPIESFTLFSSFLGHGGPSYRAEAVYSLQTPATVPQL